MLYGQLVHVLYKVSNSGCLDEPIREACNMHYSPRGLKHENKRTKSGNSNKNYPLKQSTEVIMNIRRSVGNLIKISIEPWLNISGRK